MKKKDTLSIAILLAIVAIAGMFLYAKYGSKGKDNGITQVEVIDPISSDFDQGALTTLADPTKVANFHPAITLDGVGNTRPFGPLR